MTPEQEARQNLIADLRAYSATHPGSKFPVILLQAANEIEDLADKLDHRMADQLSTVVVRAIYEKIKEETGWDPLIGAIYVSNDGFQFTISEQAPDGYMWRIACQRKERDGTERATDPSGQDQEA